MRASGADVTRFDYGRSDGAPFGADELIYEPASSTTDVVVSLGAAYAF